MNNEFKPSPVIESIFNKLINFDNNEIPVLPLDVICSMTNEEKDAFDEYIQEVIKRRS